MTTHIIIPSTPGSAPDSGPEVSPPAEPDRHPSTEVGAASRDAPPSPEVFPIHTAFPTRMTVQARVAGCALDLTEKPVKTNREFNCMTCNNNPTMSDLAG